MRALIVVVVMATAGQARADSFVGPDKALHASISGALALAGYPAMACVAKSRLVRSVGAFGVSLFFGLGKEVADAAGLGTPSWADMAWNAGGALLGAILGLVIDLVVESPLKHANSKQTHADSGFADHL